jgi:hypothetical protein
VSPGTTTIVIKHPVSVTKEFLLGQDSGFPQGTRYLSAPVIRQAQMCLIARDVPHFEDGMYHAEIHTFAMRDLLSLVTAADAEEDIQHVETKPDSGKKILTFMNIRWEISNQPRVTRIFGPKSDPDNKVVIELC